MGEGQQETLHIHTMTEPFPGKGRMASQAPDIVEDRIRKNVGKFHNDVWHQLKKGQSYDQNEKSEKDLQNRGG